MTLSGSNSKPTVQRLLSYILFLMFVIVFSLLSVVITMLVTGSVYVINNRFVHFEKINIVTIIIAVTIIGTTLIFFIRNFKKIYRSIEEQVVNRI